MRRKFLRNISLGATAVFTGMGFTSRQNTVRKPVVISTWAEGLNANKEAWSLLGTNGRALDAVEKGLMHTEATINCCVGLGGYPDRDGIVTLDASIMDEQGNAGSVAALERIKHPISVARRVMEKTPHVMLAGQGAQQFALAQGFPLESSQLSADAEKAYREWLKKSEYKPVINIEKDSRAFVPVRLSDGRWNHDTIGMLALDAAGNLSGGCTTSGMGFKMHGRVGDSPIIGAGLYVDNETGAATSSGLGEEVIRVCGTFLVVEFMRQGASPEMACKKACDRIYSRHRNNIKDFQVGFIALNKQGEYGGYSLQQGFEFAVCRENETPALLKAKSLV